MLSGELYVNEHGFPSMVADENRSYHSTFLNGMVCQPSSSGATKGMLKRMRRGQCYQHNRAYRDEPIVGECGTQSSAPLSPSLRD